MRKSVTHLKDVSRLISTPDQSGGTCQRRNFHLQTLIQMFQPSKTELFNMSHHCIPYRRKLTIFAKSFRSASSHSVDRIVEARKSAASSMRLPQSLSDMKITDHRTLLELDHAIRIRQADKAWSIFSTFSKQGDKIPLAICCSLYALLKYAKSMLGRGEMFKDRKNQIKQLLDYVKHHHHHTPKLFLPFVQHIDIPLRKKIARLIRFEEPEKAWILFFKAHTNGKERLSRTLCINLIILMIKDKSLNQNQLNHRIRTISLHSADKYSEDDRNLMASDVLRLAYICRQYQRLNAKEAHKLIDEYVTGLPQKKQKNRADAMDELIWIILSNNDLVKAQKVFDLVRNKHADKVTINETVYVNLMSAYRRKKNNPQALILFEQYLEDGYQPSIKGFNAVLQVFAAQKEAQRAAITFSAMLSLDIVPDIITYTEMIRVYGRSFNYEKCMFFYKEMIKKNIIPTVYTYSALIDASSRQYDIHGVLHWFQTMLSKDTKPNEYTVSLVLKSLSQQTTKHIPQVLDWIVKEAFLAGVRPDTILYTALLKVQSEQLGLENALSIQKEMIGQSVEPNSYTYTTLISVCGKYNVPETAQIIFELMKKSKAHKPNTATYTALISAWANSGNFQKANSLILEFLTISKTDKTNKFWIDDKLKEQIGWCSC